MRGYARAFWLKDVRDKLDIEKMKGGFFCEEGGSLVIFARGRR